MGNKYGTITAPVNPKTDVYKVLGIGPTKNGYELNYACSNAHGKINPFSRMKPVHIQNAISHDMLTNGYDTLDIWWKGSSRRCGFIVETVVSYRLIPALYDNSVDGMNGWEYDPPKGSSASPYRIEDFVGYKHDALPPCEFYEITERVSAGVRNLTAMMSGRISTDKTEPGSVGFEDIEIAFDRARNLGEFAFGVVVVDSNGAIKGCVSSKGGVCEYDPRLLSYGTYYVYPFLSGSPVEQTFDAEHINLYCALPTLGRKSFQVVSNEDYYGIQLTGYASFDRVTFDVSVVVKTAVDYKFTNNYIQVRLRTSDFDSDGLLFGEYQYKLIDFTLHAGETTTLSHTFTGPFIRDGDYRVRVSLQSGMFVRTFDPMISIS